MTKVEIKLKRIAMRETYTIGRLFINGEYVCDTIEDCDRGLMDNMPEDHIRQRKIYGQTAIPQGDYRVLLTTSETFSGRPWAKMYNGLVPRLENVKGFSGIRIHPGNTAEDSLGCIIPGENKVAGKVVNSTAAYHRIMKVLMPAWESGTPINISIL